LSPDAKDRALLGASRLDPLPLAAQTPTEALPVELYSYRM